MLVVPFGPAVPLRDQPLYFQVLCAQTGAAVRKGPSRLNYEHLCAAKNYGTPTSDMLGYSSIKKHGSVTICLMSKKSASNTAVPYPCRTIENIRDIFFLFFRKNANTHLSLLRLRFRRPYLTEGISCNQVLPSVFGSHQIPVHVAAESEIVGVIVSVGHRG